MDKKKWIIIAIVIAFIIVCGIAGYFLCEAFFTKEEGEVTNKQEKTQESQDKTIKSQTYNSKELGFSVMYPEDWKTEEFENGFSFIKRGDIGEGHGENSYIKILEGELGHGLMGVENEKSVDISFLGDNFAEKTEFSDKDNKLLLVVVIFDCQGKEYSLEFRPSEDESGKDTEKFQSFLEQNME